MRIGGQTQRRCEAHTAALTELGKICTIDSIVQNPDGRLYNMESVPPTIFAGSIHFLAVPRRVEARESLR